MVAPSQQMSLLARQMAPAQGMMGVPQEQPYADMAPTPAMAMGAPQATPAGSPANLLSQAMSGAARLPGVGQRVMSGLGGLFGGGGSVAGGIDAAVNAGLAPAVGALPAAMMAAGPALFALRGAAAFFEPSISFDDQLLDTLSREGPQAVRDYVQTGEGMGMTSRDVPEWSRAMQTGEALRRLGYGDLSGEFLTPENVEQSIAFARSPVTPGAGPDMTDEANARNAAMARLARLFQQGAVDVPADFRAGREALFGA